MSGLIVLGIVAIWVVVLVPMWLNRHDAANASRSMDTFSTAMRVLSRRPPETGDRRYVVMPYRENWGLTVDNQPNASTRRTPKAPRGRVDLVTRRRRVGMVLVTIVFLTLALGVVGIVPWWGQGLADALALGYVVHLRGQAIRARELTGRRTARAARVAAAPAREEFGAELGGRAGRAAAYRRPAAGIEASIGAGYGEELIDVSPAGTANGSRWEPVPVPLPTYVSKAVVHRPAARASVPVVDLTKPGAWTDGEVDVRHLLLDETGSGTVSASEGAVSRRYVAPPMTAEDEELDLILNRRRAVND